MSHLLNRTTVACLFALGTLLVSQAHADLALPKNAAPKPPREKAAVDADHDHGHGKRKTVMSAKSLAKRCQLNDLIRYRGWDLVEKVKTANCSNTLFDATPTQAAILFDEQQMLMVASEFRRAASDYDGTNAKNINELQEYLRAGYYYKSNNSKETGFSETLKHEIRAGLEKLFASSGSRKIWWENGDILQSGYKLISHTKDYNYFLPVIKAKLYEANTEFLAYSSTASAVNEILRLFSPMYYYDKPATEVVKRDISYANAVYALYRNNNRLIGTSTEYLLSNAMGTVADMLQFPELKSQIRPMIRNGLNGVGLFTRGEAIWLSAARKIREHDNGNCNDYGTCDAKEKWQAAVLTSTRNCTPTIKILSQGYSQADLIKACQLLLDEEKLFTYSMFGVAPSDANIIPTKFNAGLEVIAFKSKDDYSKYGGPIYGIDTNNGGITMEGDPSQPGNVQRFYAYHKEGQPLIWNLKHEFIHYIDNIYNIENYGKAYWSGQPIVWWMEGLGEYFAYENNYTEAVEAARLKTYPLSTIFRNTYDMADYQNRCYKWGYLAMRFMFERHRADIEQVAVALRAGKYDEYGKLLFERIGTRYDDEFNRWLDTVDVGGSFAGARYAGGANNAKGTDNTKPNPTGQTTFDRTKQYFLNDETLYDGKRYKLVVLIDGKQTSGYGLYGDSVSPAGKQYRSTDGRVHAYWTSVDSTPGPVINGFDIYKQYRHNDTVQLNSKRYTFNVLIDGKPDGNYALYGGSCNPGNCTSQYPFSTSDNRVRAFWQEGSTTGGTTPQPVGNFSTHQQYRDQDQTLYNGRTYRFTVRVDGQPSKNYPLYGGSCLPNTCTSSVPFIGSDGRSTAYWQ
ncbi:collagenase [Chitinivorax sp. B]|uniref:collagenase n=1 Tax=Chitinivorax sp. B TaxID=2502235 RepID=UPI0014859745|nr:collagenase [Chitinivorax sp. B]